ncbi:MAG: type I glyceraldehyde-3-phosphate dehydrogenase [Flavobacteriales bacterium]|jgi:glyceraldehyde 3-phosphate dehydrogenase|nr:type I glyceraldehyde-3-phosphate dehydrogenase [Flavobacteriales bacterium]MDP4731544.1 type I glyceraldehyde-3-phosphate dehydrogenase [Flavobacteriales bacterium]MDP4818129.1 type I glyceraldehyde-3-phosphate dehydrogenase [Flavobacteriales bacterium]MDP4951098.1 type I glyceraldehyde-3-phosphate dehydrogenase [Flavobacteriales bacterium]
MSKYRTAINGFGRIGRTLLKEVLRRNEIDVVAIHDLADMQTLLHLLKYDSTQGIFEMPIEVIDANTASIGGKEIVFLQNLSDYPWNELSVDLVFECTGTMKTEAQCEKHISNGAKRVLLSAPSEDLMPMWIVGVNDHNIDLDQKIISCASCTTNNAAPMIQIIDEAFGVESCYISTVHSYTGDQKLHDTPHKDLRRARAAVASIVPTTTGAARALTKVFPHLSERLGGCGIRVPVPNGSLSDLTFMVRSKTTAKEVNDLFEAWANTRQSILEVSHEPLVSRDIVGNKHSCIIDAELTSVIGYMIKVVGWYDNEMGYSNRLLDAAEKLMKH